MRRVNYVRKSTELSRKKERETGVEYQRIPLLDMHAHLCMEQAQEEMFVRKKYEIKTCFSCGTPEEWEYMQNFKDDKNILLSFGIHPWYADKYDPKKYPEYYGKCDFVGEIGMDSVWCEVPLNVQRRVFEAQLQIASDLKKPVILHTKGQESVIADILKDYPGKVCIHWYSGDIETLERFIDMDCCFTLGPDLKCICKGVDGEMASEAVKISEDAEKQKLYRYMIGNIPLNRLFLETDGISAVAWAMERDSLPLEEIPKILIANEIFLASETKNAPEIIRDIMKENLKHFLL